MKKIIISILTISFMMLYGCYKGENTVTVKINLNNLHAVKNVQPKTFLDKVRSFFIKNAYAADPDIFIAAEKGSEILTTVSVYSTEIAANGNMVELEVPAGDDITILVVNTSDGIAVNYDFEKVNLEAGKTENITINMISFDWGLDSDKLIYSDTNPVSWDKADFVVKYSIREYYSPNDLLYEGYDNHATINNCQNRLYIEIVPFNIKTQGFSFNVNDMCK